MFAPNPPKGEGWIIIDACTLDGRNIDPQTGELPHFAPVSFDRGVDWGQMWRIYTKRIAKKSHKKRRPALRDWLKSLHAGKILLITRDSQQQRRLRLKLLNDNRFLVLTEDQAAKAQIQSLQLQLDKIQQKPSSAQIFDRENELPEIQDHISTLESENLKLKLNNEADDGTRTQDTDGT